jgi:hypothetical protein
LSQSFKGYHIVFSLASCIIISPNYFEDSADSQPLSLSVVLGKDVGKLLRNRNDKLRAFAAERTRLTPAEFDAWLTALDAIAPDVL